MFSEYCFVNFTANMFICNLSLISSDFINNLAEQLLGVKKIALFRTKSYFYKVVVDQFVEQIKELPTWVKANLVKVFRQKFELEP